jgi:hypothetical protein
MQHTNDPTNWQKRLAGEQVPTSPSDPEYGFFRVRERKDGPLVPIAFWFKDGALRCRLNGSNVEEGKALELWPFASAQPISHETYKAVIEGENWPDIDAAVAQQLASTSDGQPRPNANPDDPAESLAAEIDNALAAVASYAKIEDDTKLAASQTARARLNELARKADSHRKELLAPVLRQQRDINATWQPIVQKAEAGAKQINAAQTAWVNEKLRRQRAEEDRIRREQQEAERKAAEAQAKHEEEVRKARKVNIPDPAPPKIDPAPPTVPTVSAPPAPIKGAYGRAATVRTKQTAIIEDQDAVYAAFKGRDEVRALLLKLAQQAVDAGHDVPGIRKEETALVR